jgi:SAM-dependent methyltransferase
MDDALEQLTHETEETHWWYAGRRRVLRALLDGLPALPAAARILDAGCGSGRNMVELARYGAVTGLELALASIDAARARGVGDVVGLSLGAPLPFEDGTFALSTSLDVLEHLQDDRSALQELRRVAAPAGRLVVTVPAHTWLWGEHDVLAHHQRRYTRRSLVAVARSAGWEPERITAFNSTLLPAVAAARGLQRLSLSHTPASDLERTPEWANRTLEQILGAEAAVVRRGVNLPLGVSLAACFSTR